MEGFAMFLTILGAVALTYAIMRVILALDK